MGMTGCLARHRPDLIVEVTDEYLRPLGDSAESMHEWLGVRGYRMFRIDAEGVLVPIPDKSALKDHPTQFNAFFSMTDQVIGRSFGDRASRGS
jgi:hypothetical protein